MWLRALPRAPKWCPSLRRASGARVRVCTRRSAPRCCRSRRSRPSHEPALEAGAKLHDLGARIVILRLVLDHERSLVPDSPERLHARLDVDDSLAPWAGVVWLSNPAHVLQVDVQDVLGEPGDRPDRVVPLRFPPARVD